MHCVEYLLKQITHANGYRTNGVLVDRAKDPRLLRQSLPELYRQHQAALVIQPGKRTRNIRVTAGRERSRYEYAIYGLRTLTRTEDAAGRTIDDLMFDLDDDIKRAIRADYTLRTSATALGYDPAAIVIINHQLDMLEGDEGANFPDVHFIAHCSFEFDEVTV